MLAEEEANVSSVRNYPLDSKEVAEQMQRLEDFIKMDMLVKVKKIDLEAEKDCNLKKTSKIKSNCQRIMQEYEQKERQELVRHKIWISVRRHEGYVAVLNAQAKLLQSVIDEAAYNLTTNLTHDYTAYTNLLQGLICQALCKVLEDKVTVRCRERDHNIVKQALTSALQQYRDISQRTDCEAVIDTNSWLPEDRCVGGVVVEALDGKIKIFNTIEERLELLIQEMLPELRTMLFGPNSVHKYFSQVKADSRRREEEAVIQGCNSQGQIFT